MADHAKEVDLGERFEFGRNWARFLEHFNDARVAAAEASLRRMLGVDLKGKTFLDIGNGSGLFSLAARRLGAKVYSFDYDPHSVQCAIALRERFYPNDPSWTINEASALDPKLPDRLGQFDVVYSWGVLHHTGRMWDAINNSSRFVKPSGLFFIAIYNDQGVFSRIWQRVKKFYCGTNFVVKKLMVLVIGLYYETKSLVPRLIRQRRVFRTQAELETRRGMSIWRDVEDMVGGYPFEVAKPEEIFDFLRARGFQLVKLKTVGGGLSCNEFVFQRRTESDS